MIGGDGIWKEFRDFLGALVTLVTMFVAIFVGIVPVIETAWSMESLHQIEPWWTVVWWAGSLVCTICFIVAVHMDGSWTWSMYASLTTTERLTYYSLLFVVPVLGSWLGAILVSTVGYKVLMAQRFRREQEFERRIRYGE